MLVRRLQPRRSDSTKLGAANLAVALALTLSLVLVWPRPSKAQDSPADASPAGMPDLVAALLATPGVLGVETAMTDSKKQVIFAWFEDKAAVLRWYYSDTHRLVQDRFVPDRPPHTPLAHVADDAGPILTVASLTLTDAPGIPGMGLPISQIAIELYQPLPGGLAVGGRFAPSAMEVPHMIEASLPTPGTER